MVSHQGGISIHLQKQLGLGLDSLILCAARTAGTVKIHKATYEANNPSEDRSTVVVGKDFVFCGVWDGHGGTPCSEFVEKEAFDLFAAAKKAGYEAHSTLFATLCNTMAALVTTSA